MTGKFLDKAYDLDGADKTQAHYDAWAATYDAEISENGYATPGRCAAALWAKLPRPDAPILDFGCGTGLSGLALKLAGYRVIDGTDPSVEMLEGARAKNVYRTLSALDLSDPAPIPTGRYRAIAAIGVIGTGAAPARTLDLLMKTLGRGDFLVFSYNDHALADPHYVGRLNQWLDCGAARLITKDYGPHLPGQNLNSNVYVVEKN
ncbi:class I SAM-dependent DNA methyltransferase [Roseovarius pelagicus]|uniref:Methyltransferase domain-containing protein n=1 Tax=Roseovarius pelagicus TaxID=2980108 RepID=A0ABY6DCF5_9RHOB|nr:methyltransferase domain-containing protein [Roseovarius pelagicus]UXX83704.1 methyltransferase domain-containing protein [Roseovarius pelagicus]